MHGSSASEPSSTEHPRVRQTFLWKASFANGHLIIGKKLATENERTRKPLFFSLTENRVVMKIDSTWQMQVADGELIPFPIFQRRSQRLRKMSCRLSPFVNLVVRFLFFK